MDLIRNLFVTGTGTSPAELARWNEFLARANIFFDFDTAS
jgi:hypothetical protein